MATKSHLSQICKLMVALKDTCLHPETNEPYIVSSKGGINNSPEANEVGLARRPLARVGLY